jgi:hypothetical protein
MALFYQYIYSYKGGEVIFYAPSRSEADQQILEMFPEVNTEKDFLRRERW